KGSKIEASVEELKRLVIGCACGKEMTRGFRRSHNHTERGSVFSTQASRLPPPLKQRAETSPLDNGIARSGRGHRASSCQSITPPPAPSVTPHAAKYLPSGLKATAPILSPNCPRAGMESSCHVPTSQIRMTPLPHSPAASIRPSELKATVSTLALKSVS